MTETRKLASYAMLALAPVVIVTGYLWGRALHDWFGPGEPAEMVAVLSGLSVMLVWMGFASILGGWFD